MKKDADLSFDTSEISELRAIYSTLGVSNGTHKLAYSQNSQLQSIQRYEF